MLSEPTWQVSVKRFTMHSQFALSCIFTRNYQFIMIIPKIIMPNITFTVARKTGQNLVALHLPYSQAMLVKCQVSHSNDSLTKA